MKFVQLRMAHYRNFKPVLNAVLLLALAGRGLGEGPGQVSLFKCKEFRDDRVEPPPGGPAQLTIRREEMETDTISFLLKEHSQSAGLSCKRPLLHNVPVVSRFPQDFPVRKHLNSSDLLPLQTHFTEDGLFFGGRHYLHPKHDFCVRSISDQSVGVDICYKTCGKSSSSSSPSEGICLPKCCAIDEVLLFWTQECVKLNSTSGSSGGSLPRWKPKVYKKDWNGGYNPTSGHVYFQVTEIPADCNNQSEPYEPYRKVYSSAFLRHPNESLDYSQTDDGVRLAVGEKGMVQPFVFYHQSRSWKVEEDVPFCADAFLTPDHPHLRQDHWTILYCDEHKFMGKQEAAESKSTIYTVASFLALPFMLATVVVYLILLDKLNLHGLTILSYSIAGFMSYLMLIIAHLVFLGKYQEWIGLGRRGWFCYSVAVSAHFFYIASYIWLTVMNFDLWMTFRSMRVIRRDAKEPKKYTIYSLIGWGIPLVALIAFMIIDEVYREPTTEVPVPDYAVSTCFVTPDFRGYYLYIPMAIILTLNCFLILLTMKIFVDARRQNKASLADGKGPSNATKYSAKLFAKIFIVMGGASIVDFLSWYYSQYEEMKPWWVVILESISYLVPILYFVLFCLNDRTLGQLQEKFPRLTEWRKLFKLGAEEASTATTESDTGRENIKMENRMAKGYSSTATSTTTTSDK